MWSLLISFFIRCCVATSHKDHEEDGEFSSKTLHSFYVDDLVSRCESNDKALDVYRKLKERMLAGGFMFSKWKTNDMELLNWLNESESVEKEERFGQLEMPYVEETLGPVKDFGGKKSFRASLGQS